MSRLRVQELLERAGRIGSPPSRSVVVAISDSSDLPILDRTVDMLCDSNQRLSVFFICEAPEVTRHLSNRYGESALLTKPWNNAASALLFLLTSRARLLLGIGSLDGFPAMLVKQAYLSGIGIAAIGISAPPEKTAGNSTSKPLLAMSDWVVPKNRRSAENLRAEGLAVADLETEDLAASARWGDVIAQLNVLMSRRPPARRLLQKNIAARLDRPRWRPIIAMRARRIESLEEFKSELGDPRTILCLGSGPSSEDPALDEIKYDSLFRVNHRWLKRGRLCRPDVVFTGQKRTLFTLRGPIMALQTRRAETHLVTHQIFNPLCPKMRFVTLERLGILDNRDWDGIRPTNGATMIATAVALEPDRLIIAGVDLFEDPAGAYPGDDRTPNDYVLVHERQLEIAFILETLRKFRGELTVLSKALADRLEKDRAGGDVPA